jgi:hypothetical protein
MNTLTVDQALSSIDKKFRAKILSAYKEIKSRYSKALYSLEYDTAGLSAGKFCESVLRFLQQHLTGSSLPFGKHIPNFNDECLKIIGLPKSAGNESLRVLIPRALQLLYTLRGKRGIGHVGGDVEANKIDVETIVRITDWIICELIRIFHNLSLEEAQSIIDSISEKSMPEIWEIAGKKRVLATNLDFKEKTLLLLYQSSNNFEFDTDLFSWVEYSDFSMFRKAILKQLHEKKIIEYDKETDIVYLSPKGIIEVETTILPKLKQ